MTMFQCPSDILITSWLFTAQWSTWPENHLLLCVAELIYRLPCKNYSSSYIVERGRKFALRIKEHKKEVDTFTAGTQTQASGQGRAVYLTIQPSQTMPWKRRERCHRLGQGKSGRQKGTATDQKDKRGTLDQEDTDMHESGCRILPTQPHVGLGDFQVTCSIEL